MPALPFHPDHRIVRFHPGTVTFTPAVAKRTAKRFDGGWVEELFGAAIAVHGGPQGADLITAPRGQPITGAFYTHLDPHQGTLVLWIVPEWAGDDGRDHALLHAGDALSLTKTAASQLTLHIAGEARVTVDVSTWENGEKYLIIARWDAHNPLNATHHACLTVEVGAAFSPTFGAPDAWTVASPPSELQFGTEDGSQAGGCSSPADCLYEGLTLYRRPLYDGSAGVDAGNGDEIAAIYNSGSYAKPVPITGREDVVFRLPTDETPGTFVSGTGEAFAFPYASNLLTDWHLQDAGAAAWTARGSAALAKAAADTRYGARALRISDIDAVDDGASQTYNCSSDPAGQNYALFAVLKDDGTHPVDVRIRDLTHSTDIATLSTAGSGTWEHLNTHFNRPAGCDTIAIFVESTHGGAGPILLQQLMLLPAAAGTVLWDDVTLTVTPAPLAASLHGATLRIDGADTALQAAPQLTAARGDIRFHACMRTPSDYETKIQKYLLDIYYDADNHLRLFTQCIPRTCLAGAVRGSAFAHNHTETIDNRRHAYRITWDTQTIDYYRDQVLITTFNLPQPFPADFAPQIYWGSKLDGTDQLDGWLSP